MVRCFEDPNVIWRGRQRTLRDIETINLELIFADLEVLERRLSKVAVSAARMDKTLYAKELALLERIKEHLSGRWQEPGCYRCRMKLASLKE